jgi:hypothetical protein
MFDTGSGKSIEIEPENLKGCGSCSSTIPKNPGGKSHNFASHQQK